MPKVTKSILSKQNSDVSSFPVDHYSASSMVQFSSNPILYKIKYVNRDHIETSFGISRILGKAFHYAMSVYQGGSDTMIPSNESEAIEYGLKAGMDYLDKYEDGFISYSKTIPNKQKAFDLLSFCFTSYVQQIPYIAGSVVSVEDEIKMAIDVEWNGKQLKLPVKLKGFIDVTIREKGKLKIKDYKTCYAYSNPEKIDGAKILQAIEYYLLTYAKTGEEPYSIIFEEVKYTKNSDGSPQVKQYEIVYAENPLYFDFYFRFYEDMTAFLNGDARFIPNVNALFDNEIAIIAYVHRLDDSEEVAKLMKKHKVENITDLLKTEIQNSGNMRKFLKTVEEGFVSAKNLNYEKMKNEEKIQTKMMEHGMMLKFDSIISGATVDLYQYTPSIGLKMARIRNYVDDVEQVLGITGVRVLAPIPNSTMVGFEVPRKERSFPSVPSGDGFDIAIGQTIMGGARRFDIRYAPHILVAGASGSGKSVFLSGLIEQLARIKNADLHLFDPKRVELKQFKNKAVQYEFMPEAIYNGLIDLEKEMMKRYDKMQAQNARNIEQMHGMKYKFVILDEFGELIVGNHMMSVSEETGHIFVRGQNKGEKEIKTTEINLSKEIENKILRIAQLGRACGIHLVIATQRPSADIIKGTIKANFPTKVVFKTSKAIDSIVILDEPGAEKLAGKGDMLFSGDNGLERLQGYLI